jgi:transposase
MKHVDRRKLPAAAQEERRRQVIGLRQAGQTCDAIAAQVGLTRTGVFDICKRYAERGAAGLKSAPRGPEPGTGRFLDRAQEAEVRDLIRRHTPDELDPPFALWSRAAVQELVLRRFGVRLAVRSMGTCLALGLHRAEAAAAGLRAGPGRGAAVAAAGLPGHRGPGQAGSRRDLLGR